MGELISSHRILTGRLFNRIIKTLMSPLKIKSGLIQKQQQTISEEYFMSRVCLLGEENFTSLVALRFSCSIFFLIDFSCSGHLHSKKRKQRIDNIDRLREDDVFFTQPSNFHHYENSVATRVDLFSLASSSISIHFSRVHSF